MKTIKYTIFLFSLAGAGLTPSAVLGDETVMSASMVKPLTAQQFVDDAAVSGMKEVRMSELALTNSQNTEVKNFATRMITDHSAVDQKLEKLAREQGLDFPTTNTFAANDPAWNNPMLTGSDTVKGEGAYLLTTNVSGMSSYQDLKHLQTLSGREFDLAYVKVMVADHLGAISEFEMAKRDLTNPALRKFAADTLPKLRDHSQMAQKLDNQLAGLTADTLNPLSGESPVATANADTK